MVAADRGLLPRAAHRPGGRRGHRAPVTRTAGPARPARPRAVLRVACAGRPPPLGAAGAAARQVSRPPDRPDRPGRAAVAGLAGHRHRLPARAAGRPAGRHSRDRDPDHLTEQLQRRELRRGRRPQRGRDRPHPVHDRAGPAVPGADVHRHRHPAVRRPPGTAVRRHAADRGDAPADQRARRHRVGGRGRGRHCGRVRRVLRDPPGRGRVPVHRRGVLHGRPVAQCSGHRGRGAWRTAGRGSGQPDRAAPGPDLTAGRQPPDPAARPAGLAADPARGRPRRAGVLRDHRRAAAVAPRARA